MRLPSLLLCIALVSASSGISSVLGAPSASAPNTPTGGATSESSCQLSGLSFTNGLSLVESFSPSKYSYTCGCGGGWFDPFTTRVVPVLASDTSSVEITFNGATVNSLTASDALSNSGRVASSPGTQSSPLTFPTGDNTITVGVSCNGKGKPNPCYYQYIIKCHKPDPGVCGDPQFVGLRGQNYQVHGVAGEIYNIVSDSDLQYNSRFVFLDRGDCPVVDGRKQKNCFSHPGSYLGELGLKTRAGDLIRLASGPAKGGFATVEVNGRTVEIGETVLLAEDLGSVSRNTTHFTSVVVGNWDFGFENSDMYVNQRVRISDSRGLRAHGLLGQTWRETTYPNAIKHIQGQVDDYVIREGKIFGDNFLYNAFN